MLMSHFFLFKYLPIPFNFLSKLSVYYFDLQKKFLVMALNKITLSKEKFHKWFSVIYIFEWKTAEILTLLICGDYSFISQNRKKIWKATCYNLHTFTTR